jgi:hypothetical protein
VASFDFCINQAIKEGKITKDLGEEILESSDPAAMIAAMAGNAAQKKREAAVDAIRRAQRMEEINSHPNGPYHGLMSILTRDTKEVAGYQNIDLRSRTITNFYASTWAEALSAFRTRTFGLTQDEKAIAEFIAEVYYQAIGVGVQSTKAEIRNYAKGWINMIEEMRKNFNALGGNISKNDNYLFPQKHDMRRVKNATEDTWVEYVKPLMDKSKMLDDTGKVLDEDGLDALLRHVYKTISTGGINKAQGLTPPKGVGQKLSRQGSEQRILYFKDAESWMAYQKDYGKGDIFSLLTDHIQHRANDIALIETLGTNPRNMFEGLKFQANKMKPLSGKEKMRLESTYKVVSGEINGGELTTLADFGQFTRNIMVGTYYPAAFLASMVDTATVSLTAAYNGMSATKTLARIASMGGEEERLFAAKIGLISQAWLGRAHSTNRLTDTFGVGVDAKIAEATMRASMLEEWTNRSRKAFGMESAANIASNFGKSFDELPKRMQKQFTKYGITPEDWNAFRGTQAMTFDGVKFADFTKDKSQKFHSMVLLETDFAVPTPTARERGLLTAGTQRATVEGQAIRQLGFAKTHPVTIMMMHWNRTMNETGLGSKVAYGGAFALGTTTMAAVAIHAKDIVKGKEMREMDGEFWKQAFLMGGAGSLIADYALVDPGDYGNSPIETMIGPGAQFFNRTFDLTLGNVHEAIKGEEMNVLGDIAKYTKYVTPGIWQTDIFFNSMMDQAILSVDPTYQKSINRIRRQEMKDYGRGFWWGPGETIFDVLEE